MFIILFYLAFFLASLEILDISFASIVWIWNSIVLFSSTVHTNWIELSFLIIIFFISFLLIHIMISILSFYSPQFSSCIYSWHLLTCHIYVLTFILFTIPILLWLILFSIRVFILFCCRVDENSLLSLCVLRYFDYILILWNHLSISYR
jgi:hypothetical protein